MASSGPQSCWVGKIKRHSMAFKSSVVIILLLFTVIAPLKARGQFLGDYKAVFKTACKETMALSSKANMPQLQDFTVCLHLKLTSDRPWTAFTYKPKANESSRADSYELGLAGDSGNLIVWIFGTQITVPEKLSLHTWYQTCIIWASRNQKIDLSINGKSVENKHLKGKSSLAGNGLLSLGCSQYPGMSSSAAAVGLVGELYLFRMWKGAQSDFEDCVDGDVIQWDMEDWVYSNSTLEKDKSLQCAKRDDPRLVTTSAAGMGKHSGPTISPLIAAPLTAVANLLDINSVVGLLVKSGEDKTKSLSINNGTAGIIMKNSLSGPEMSVTLAVSSPVSITASTTSPHMNNTGNFSCPFQNMTGMRAADNSNVCNISDRCIDSVPYYVNMKVEDIKGNSAAGSITNSSIKKDLPPCTGKPIVSALSPYMSLTLEACMEKNGRTINFTGLLNLKKNTTICEVIQTMKKDYSFIDKPEIRPIEVCCCTNFTKCPSNLDDLDTNQCYKSDKLLDCDPNNGTTASTASPGISPSNGTSSNPTNTDTILAPSSNGTLSSHTPTAIALAPSSKRTSSSHAPTAIALAPSSKRTSSSYAPTATSSAPSSNGTSSSYAPTAMSSAPSSNHTSGSYAPTATSSAPSSNHTSGSYAPTATSSAPSSNHTSGSYAPTATSSALSFNGTSSSHAPTAKSSAPSSNDTSSSYAPTATSSAPSSNGTSSSHAPTAKTSASSSNGTLSSHAPIATSLTPSSNGTSRSHAPTAMSSAPSSNGTLSSHAPTATSLTPSSNGTLSSHAPTATSLTPSSNGTSSSHASTSTTSAHISNVTSTNHPTATTTPAPGSPSGTLNGINDMLNSSNLNGSMVNKMVTDMESILLGNASIDSTLAGKFVDVVNNFLNVSSDLLAPVSNRLIRIVDTVGLRLNFSTESLNFTSTSLALAVTKVNATNFKQVSFAIEQTSQLQVSLGTMYDNGSAASVTLPSSLLSDLSPENKSLASRIQFNFFEKTTLFKNGSEWNMSLISSVISSSVANITLNNLKENVTVILKTNRKLDEINNTVYCMFWNFSADGGLGNWASEGCTVASSGINQTICKCNHLTSFGVLLDLSREPIIDPVQHLILTFITYIGCGLSAIFLSVTLITYLAFEKIRRDYPSKILIQLCAALLLLNLVFLLDSWIALYDHVPGLCISVAVFLHYFLLVSFTWMALEAFHMYLALVKVFNTYVRKYILKFCIVGWGLPAVIVAIVLAIKKEFYGHGSYGKFPNGSTDEFCWINNDVVFYITVVGYFCLIFLVNTSMFIVVLIQLCRIKKRKQLSSQRKTSIQDVRSVAGLMFLLGTTWGFAFFAWGPVNLAFMYLFAIFNTLQGFFIFLFYCLGKENVRKQWRQYLCCGRFRLAENSDWSRTATNGLKKQTLNQGTSSSSINSIQSTSNGNSTGSTNSTTLLMNNGYSMHPDGNGPFYAERNNIALSLQNNDAHVQNFASKQLHPGEGEGGGHKRKLASAHRTSNKGNIRFSDQI